MPGWGRWGGVLWRPGSPRNWGERRPRPGRGWGPQNPWWARWRKWPGSGPRKLYNPWQETLVHLQLWQFTLCERGEECNKSRGNALCSAVCGSELRLKRRKTLKHSGHIPLSIYISHFSCHMLSARETCSLMMTVSESGLTCSGGFREAIFPWLCVSVIWLMWLLLTTTECSCRLFLQAQPLFQQLEGVFR